MPQCSVVGYGTLQAVPLLRMVAFLDRVRKAKFRIAYFHFTQCCNWRPHFGIIKKKKNNQFYVPKIYNHRIQIMQWAFKTQLQYYILINVL
jgi:hypothetical protein